MKHDAVLLSYPELSQAFILRPGNSVIGRSAEADLQLQDHTVSRRHAMITNDGKSLAVTDLSSQNGTIVNGGKIASGVTSVINDGSILQFGASIFLVRFYEETVPWPAPVSVPVTIEPDLSSHFELSRTSTELHSAFGFEQNQVKYLNQGIARRTADQLSKKYTWIDLINRGGMGKIFLVQERLSKRFVALKVMTSETEVSEAHVQQFVREAVITARLQHPNVIPVYDLGFVQTNQLYYTMRYVDGTSFSMHMQQPSLHNNLRIIRYAAMAVDHAHEQGLWHRDVKPANILIAKTGEVYVIDWGLVSVQPGRNYLLDIPRVLIDRRSYYEPDRLLEDTPEAISSASYSMDDQVVIGTPSYMSPEQLNNDVETMGVVSDVWAFGVMLYECLTNRRPLDFTTRMSNTDMKRLLHTSTIAHVCEVSQTPYPELAELCMSMLDKVPAKRLQSLFPLIEQLSPF